jgi:hypothetical protein
MDCGLVVMSRREIERAHVMCAIQERREEALSVVRARYPDFGPTLAHEKLVEVHGLRMSDGM